jgi:hypothetical protein
MSYQKTGMEFLEQQASDLLDQWALLIVKFYFCPYFIAGVSDNISAILNPKSYSICKL